MLNKVFAVLLLIYFLGSYVSAIALGYVYQPIEYLGYFLCLFILVKEMAFK